MDKGQHFRLLVSAIQGTTATASKFVALATELTFHLSATTEEDSTKDTTDDVSGTNWNEYDVTQRNGEINFGALVAVGTDDNGKQFADWIGMVNDYTVEWKISLVGGTNNRTVGKTLCSGQGKLTNLQASAPNRQKATYSGTIQIYGQVTVGTD
jgi:hypothetical protein